MEDKLRLLRPHIQAARIYELEKELAAVRSPDYEPEPGLVAYFRDLIHCGWMHWNMREPPDTTTISSYSLKIDKHDDNISCDTALDRCASAPYVPLPLWMYDLPLLDAEPGDSIMVLSEYLDHNEILTMPIETPTLGGAMWSLYKYVNMEVSEATVGAEAWEKIQKIIMSGDHDQFNPAVISATSFRPVDFYWDRTMIWNGGLMKRRGLWWWEIAV